MGRFIDRIRYPETVYYRRFGDVMSYEPNPKSNDKNGGHFVGRWLDAITFENFDGDRLIFPPADANGIRNGVIEWVEQ